MNRVYTHPCPGSDVPNTLHSLPSEHCVESVALYAGRCASNARLIAGQETGPLADRWREIATEYERLRDLIRRA